MKHEILSVGFKIARFHTEYGHFFYIGPDVAGVIKSEIYLYN